MEPPEVRFVWMRKNPPGDFLDGSHRGKDSVHRLGVVLPSHRTIKQALSSRSKLNRFLDEGSSLFFW